MGKSPSRQQAAGRGQEKLVFSRATQMVKHSTFKKDEPLRLAVLQRVCPKYCKSLFARIAADPDWS